MEMIMIERDKEHHQTTITFREQTEPLEVKVTSQGAAVAEWKVDNKGLHQL